MLFQMSIGLVSVGPRLLTWSSFLFGITFGSAENKCSDDSAHPRAPNKCARNWMSSINHEPTHSDKRHCDYECENLAKPGLAVLPAHCLDVRLQTLTDHRPPVLAFSLCHFYYSCR